MFPIFCFVWKVARRIFRTAADYSLPSAMNHYRVVESARREACIASTLSCL